MFGATNFSLWEPRQRVFSRLRTTIFSDSGPVTTILATSAMPYLSSSLCFDFLRATSPLDLCPADQIECVLGGDPHPSPTDPLLCPAGQICACWGWGGGGGAPSPYPLSLCPAGQIKCELGVGATSLHPLSSFPPFRGWGGF